MRQADWSAVAGAVSLAGRATYFLGVTPGTLTTTPPATPGQVVQPVGVAVDTQTLDLTIGDRFLL